MGVFEYSSHKWYLVVFLHDVLLIDAYSVNPEITTLMAKTKSPQSIPQLATQIGQAIVAQYLERRLRGTPSVRNCLVSLSHICQRVDIDADLYGGSVPRGGNELDQADERAFWQRLMDIFP